MNLPKFTADSALGKSTRTYRGRPQFGSFSQSGVAVQPNQLDEAEGAEGLDQMEGSEGLDDAGGDDGMLADEAEGGEDFGGDEGSEEGGEEGLEGGEDAGEGDEGGEGEAEEG